MHARWRTRDTYRVIMHDQRGCGKSISDTDITSHPFTTHDLVADMEVLRCHLGVEQWVVFGHSWGTLLAVAYAGTHPTRVSGLLLYGIFNGA